MNLSVMKALVTMITEIQAQKFERERAESLANQVHNLESQNQKQATQIQDLEETVEFFTELQEVSNS